MSDTSIARLRSAIRDIPDFPQPGVVFKDITPILAASDLFREAVQVFADACAGKDVQKIVGIDARGFIFGAAAALEIGAGFVPVRKQGKLPFKTRGVAYSLEYGQATVEMHIDAIHPGERVVIMDDLLATGGTAAAAAQLVREVGADLLEIQFLIELSFLNGRQRLGATPVRSFITY